VTNLIFEIDQTKHLFPIEEWFENTLNTANESLSLNDLAYLSLRCSAALLSSSRIERSKIKDCEQNLECEVLLQASFDFIPAYASIFIDVEKFGYEEMRKIKEFLNEMYFNIYIEDEQIFSNRGNLLKEDCEFCLVIREVFSKYSAKFFS
jgi:hypothetical protein